MEMNWYLIATTIWVACGILAYAIMFAELQKRYPILAKGKGCYQADMALSIFVGLFGVPGLLVALLMTGFARYGLKFR
jgi:hypothetical protein